MKKVLREFPLIVRFTEKEHNQLTKAAEANQQSLSEFIRQAVRQSIQEQDGKKCHPICVKQK